jgi:peptidoglycan/LPS O-acetylase OafA/YrhL
MEYSRAVDGLRFFAFFAVFVHHFGPPIPIFAISTASPFGWSGVEIFFAISGFLMMRLLLAEHGRNASINIPNFYMRRLLRIYPLMVFYSLVMFIVFPSDQQNPWGRLLGLLTGTDNVLTALTDYNMGVSFSPHLWTLSYELQIYLLIPVAVLVFLRLGPVGFAMVLAGIELTALAAREAFILVGTQYMVIWVLPFLRPESTLIGLAIGGGLIRLPPLAASLILVGAVAALVTGANLQAIGSWTLVIFGLCGLISASSLSLALNSAIVGRILGHPILTFLGKISYGLYVYHIWVIYYIGGISRWLPNSIPPQLQYAFDFAFQLLATIIIATASYYVVERPFLRIKERQFSTITKGEEAAVQLKSKPVNANRTRLESSGP